MIPDVEAYLADDSGELENINAYFGGHGLMLRDAVAHIAERENISKDWLDEAVKETLCDNRVDKGWIEYPNLRVYLASPSHLFAMQVATATSSQDIEVIEKLAQKLHLSTTRDALPYVKEYIPNKLLTPEMRLNLKQAILLVRANRKVQANE